MTNLTSTQLPPLEFDSNEQKKQKTNAVTSKIGWIHTLSDNDGAKFDIRIKDSLGRVKFQKLNCNTETNQYGELINLPTMIGEELEVEIDNLQGAKNIKVFLN